MQGAAMCQDINGGSWCRARQGLHLHGCQVLRTEVAGRLQQKMYDGQPGQAGAVGQQQRCWQRQAPQRVQHRHPAVPKHPCKPVSPAVMPALDGIHADISTRCTFLRLEAQGVADSLSAAEAVTSAGSSAAYVMCGAKMSGGAPLHLL